MSTTARKIHNGVEGRGAHSTKRATPRHSSHATGRRMVRKRSNRQVFGFPLWEVARGPNPAKGERVGHARAIIAVGDIADGVLAIGGISRGLISIGGISIGVCSLGGVSLGLAAAVGGVAIAPLALGGIALGALALGGAGYDIHGHLHGRLHHQPQSMLSAFLACFPNLTASSRIPLSALGGRQPGGGRR